MNRSIRAIAPFVCALAMAGTCGCGLKAPAKPQWSVTLRVPLAERALSVADIASRTSFLTLDSAGTASLHWSQDLSQVSVGTSLALASFQSDASAPLGLFQVNPVAPAAIQVDLTDIWPQAVGFIGQSAVVPPIQFAPVRSAQTSNFQSAQVSAGAIRVTVVNSLPVPLNSSTLAVSNTSGGTLGTLQFGPLSPGDSASAILDLSGKTVLSSWTGTWTGSSPGSSGPVPIPANASVRTSFAFQGPLIVSSAVAPLPAQSVDWSSSTALPDTERLEIADFSSGFLNLNLDNRWGIGGTVHITLPDVTLADHSALAQTVQLAASRVVHVSVPLAGTRFVAPDPSHPQLRVVGTVQTPGSGNINLALNSTDVIAVHSDVTGAVLSRAQGVFAPFRVTLDPVTRTLDVPDGIGTLGLADAGGTLRVTSTAGVPARVVLQVSGRDNEGGEWALSAAGGGALVLNIPAAPEGGSAVGELALNGANSNLSDFLGHLPRQVDVTGYADVGDAHNASTVRSTDTFTGHFDLNSALFASFSESEIHFDADSVKLSSNVRDQIKDRLGRVRLHVTILNGLPLGADATVHLGPTRALAESPGPETVTLTASALAGTQGGANGAVAQPAQNDVVLEVSGSQLDLFQHSPIYVGGKVHLPGTAGQRVKVRGQDEVRARVWLEAEGKVVR